ncbi:MAG: LPP20 family lipoprotein, partial [Schleiferiaceae bacterium]|nr:LPP20 family lipoprotein [Schleiferiaceae bacterium]
MKLVYLFSIFFLIGCSSTKVIEPEPTVAPAPNWVKQKPIESPYYSGIGMAIKSSPDYLAIAKNNALNDLASEISVQIKSSSVLYQVENNDRFREEFKANT